jgi:hypothetical protein
MQNYETLPLQINNRRSVSFVNGSFGVTLADAADTSEFITYSYL